MSLLGVVIPTRDHAESLRLLLGDLDVAAHSSATALDVAILDNSSNGATVRMLASAMWRGLNVTVHPSSAALSGSQNVSRALALGRAGRCDYAWLLSDHMRVKPLALRSLHPILNDYRPGLMYATIEDYGTPVRVPPGFADTQDQLRARSLRQFVLFTSNISGIVVDREILGLAASSVSKYGDNGYPHLSCVDAALRRPQTVLAVSGPVSSFQAGPPSAIPQYGVMRSRAIGLGRSIELMRASTNANALSPRAMLREPVFSAWFRTALMAWACNATADHLSPQDVEELRRLYGRTVASQLVVARAARSAPPVIGQLAWAVGAAVMKGRSGHASMNGVTNSVAAEFARVREAHRNRAARGIF